MVNGGVAQLVEQGIHKPWVTGSSPVAAIAGSDRKSFRRFILRTPVGFLLDLDSACGL